MPQVGNLALLDAHLLRTLSFIGTRCFDDTTVNYDKVPVYSENPGFWTCSQLNDYAKYFETESSYCRVHQPVLQSFCCILTTTAAPTPASTATTVSTSLPSDLQLLIPAPTATSATTSFPSDLHILNHTVQIPGKAEVESQEGGGNGKVNVISISAIVISSVAGIALMALAACFLRKRASNTRDPIKTPEGGIPTAVAVQVDPKAAISQPSVWEMKMRPPRSTDAPAHVSPSASAPE
jgi:hypothetical protein